VEIASFSHQNRRANDQLHSVQAYSAFRTKWLMPVIRGSPMSEINTRFLFTIALEIQVSNLGDTPYGRGRIFHFDAGSFEGPKLKGRVLPGGGGSSLIRRDDVMEVDVRLILETDNDKHQIYMTWKGLRHGPKEVMDRVHRGEIVDPGAYYFRTTPYFETSSEKYGWLNRICSIARGSLSANARTLDVFHVL
jgi:Protein of unknown function (DUF3237)